MTSHSEACLFCMLFRPLTKNNSAPRCCPLDRNLRVSNRGTERGTGVVTRDGARMMFASDSATLAEPNEFNNASEQ